MIIALLVLVALLLAIKAARKFRRLQSAARSRRPLPPGPTPLPFLGNVLGMNRDAPHLTYTEWSKIYGDIMYLRVLGQDIVVLNSDHVAIELLEKRSKKYSDRPVFSFADLFDFEWPSSSARYGPRFRFSASVVMEVTYGYDMKGGETFVTSMQRSSDIVLSVAKPELFALCLVFPFVKVLPAWLPGMGWKSDAAECRRLVSDGVNTPYAWVKQRVKQGNASPSMVANAIIRYRPDDDAKNPELVQAIKESAATLYATSVETTYATLLVFVYLMMNHPEIQQRAQAEIDSVVGLQRLPDFGDRESLPYVDAVLREIMRHCPVGPLGIPHATTEEDVYEGYYIPQGATVMVNVWAMSRDEKKYPNPEKFMPERFLREDGSLNDDKVPYVFGFGRRNCPGRHVADASLWSAIVCMLALFRIEKTEGSEDVEWTMGMTTHPLPFPCRFVTRNEKMDSEKLASLISSCVSQMTL